MREDRRLKQQILAVHVKTKQRYGTPRVERQLRRSGTRTSRKRVARLRRELGLRTRYSRRYRVTTDSSHRKPIAPNRLARCFASEAANRIWVGDTTYLRAGASWLYLAVLLDVYSRRVVGWSLSSRNDEELVRRALERALASRRPAQGWVHHTDRGATYCADHYRERVEQRGGVTSMSRKGDCWDNAMAESFFKTLKAELGERFSSSYAARREVFAYIEAFYNTQRLHSYLGYVSPIEYEAEKAA